MSELKERPILFSGPMVRAILDGRKTQTRRIVSPQPKRCRPAQIHGEKTGDWFEEQYHHRFDRLFRARWKCPFGNVGDRLWVREKFYNDIPGSSNTESVYYPADSTSERWCCDLIPECCCAEVGTPRITPSIHMPRWASRITLEVTGVRVERLQDISEEDAKREGVDPGCLTCGQNCLSTGGCRCCRPCYKDSFIALWESIHGRDSWSLNPWVWVVSVRVI